MLYIERILPQSVREQIEEERQINDAKKIGYDTAHVLLESDKSKEDMNREFREVRDQLILEGLGYHAIAALSVASYTAMIQRAQGIDVGP